MGNVLLYVPGGCERNRNGLRGLGLEIYDDDGVTLHATDAIGETPDGACGTLFYWTPRGAKNLKSQIPQMDAATQTWKPCVADGEHAARRAWIGWATDDPPRADELFRAKTQGGQLLALDDGAEWLIPVARQLPRKVVFDGNGEAKDAIVAEKFRAFWDATLAAADLFTATSSGFEADYVDALNFCSLALSVNYRIGRDLVAGLGLLTTDHFLAIPRIAAEFDMWIELVSKKKAQDDLANTSPGSAA